MESIEQKTIIVSPGASEGKEPEDFKPTGAIAFFVVLVLLSLATWFGIYLLMLHRV